MNTKLELIGTRSCIAMPWYVDVLQEDLLECSCTMSCDDFVQGFAMAESKTFSLILFYYLVLPLLQPSCLVSSIFCTPVKAVYCIGPHQSSTPDLQSFSLAFSLLLKAPHLSSSLSFFCTLNVFCITIILHQAIESENPHHCECRTYFSCSLEPSQVVTLRV